MKFNVEGVSIKDLERMLPEWIDVAFERKNKVVAIEECVGINRKKIFALA